MKITVCKSYVMPKDGLKSIFCADSVALSDDKSRFAIADGVTQSYLPQFFSRALTKAFVERDDPAGQFFTSPETAATFNKVITEWNDQCIAAEEEADEFTKSMYAERRHDYPYAASTFAGVSIENEPIERIGIVSLGDSCIFIIPDGKGQKPIMVTSMPHTMTEDTSELWFDCSFGSRPHIINTEGYLSTHPLTETYSPGSCWLLMMTDALSEWFVKHFKRNDESEVLKQLTALEDQQQFEDFVKSQRVGEIMNDDDTAIIIVRIEDENDSTANEQTQTSDTPLENSSDSIPKVELSPTESSSDDEDAHTEPTIEQDEIYLTTEETETEQKSPVGDSLDVNEEETVDTNAETDDPDSDITANPTIKRSWVIDMSWVKDILHIFLKNAPKDGNQTEDS